MRRKSAFLVVLWLAEVNIAYCPKTVTQNQNEHECRLSKDIVGIMFNSVEATWTVDDDFLSAHQLQDVLDYTRNGETIALNVSKVIAPTKSLVIRKRIIIRPYQTSESRTKVTLTCPQDDSLMMIENTNVLLENLIIKGCSFRESVAFNSIIRLKCEKIANEAFVVNLLNVDFSNDRSPRGSTGIHLENPSCMSITMKGVAFQNNDLPHGSMLTYKNDLNKIVALWNAWNTLLEIDFSFKLNDGDGTIVFALPLLEAGNYSIVLRVSGINSRSVTLNLKARNCLAKEFLREDEKRCIRCEGEQCNNRVENDGNEYCLRLANYFGNYSLSVPGSWSSFPCSTHIQKCLNRDACLGLENPEVQKTILASNATACNLLKDERMKYRDAQCDDGYQGLLCGVCKKDYGRMEINECVPCQNRVLIIIAMIASACLLIYSVWEQIAANLELIKTRWMRRLERPSCEEREANLQRALQMSDRSDEYIVQAQKAKEKFVLVMQIMLNFVQAAGACLSLYRKWPTFLPELVTASNWINLNVSQVYKFSYECLLPVHGEMHRSVLSTLLAMLVPFVIIGIFCMYWLYNTFELRKPWKHFMKRCILSTVSVVYVCYYSLVKIVQSAIYYVPVFDAASLHSKDSCAFYWGTDTSVQLLKDKQGFLVFLAGFLLSLFLGVYLWGLVYVYITARKRDALHSEWIHETLGVLFIGFRPGYEWWDIVIQLRKGIIAGSVVNAYYIGSLGQGISITSTFASLAVAYLVLRPYRTDFKDLNFLEGMSVFVCALTALIGTILANQHVSLPIKAALIAIVFVINAVSIIVYGYHLITNKLIEIKYTLLLKGVVDEEDKIGVVLLKYLQEKLKSIRKLFGRVAATRHLDLHRNRSEIAGSSSASLLPSSSCTDPTHLTDHQQFDQEHIDQVGAE